MLKNSLALYLVMPLLGWLTTFFYVFYPEVFVFLNVPCLAGFILPPLFYYRIIHFLTQTEREERFSPLHYLAPALIGAVFLIWSLFVPFDVQATLVKSRALFIAGKYELYSRIFTLKPLLRVVFIFVYYIFIAQLLVRYYRRANDADSPVCKRRPAKWIIFLIILSLVFMFSSLMTIFLSRKSILSSVYTAIAAVGTSLQYILLTYHIISRKYVLYAVYSEPETDAGAEAESVAESVEGHRLHSGKLTRRRLNAYFRQEKPYLQGDYKIADLAEAMDVNRSVISTFINKNYGVNFNRFVNRWRLNELERLRALPSNKNKSIAGLVGKAGFTDLRQYFRAAAAEKITN
jgi:AraC-like DNA-binding protein